MSIRNKPSVAFITCLVVVCLAEGGQFYIQERNPDGMDVLFAALGSLLGIGSVQLLRSKTKRKPNEEH